MAQRNDALVEMMGSIQRHGYRFDGSLVVNIGPNSRLDTLQAAVRLAELEARRRIADIYDSELQGCGRNARAGHVSGSGDLIEMRGRVAQRGAGGRAAMEKSMSMPPGTGSRNRAATRANTPSFNPNDKYRVGGAQPSGAAAFDPALGSPMSACDPTYT